MCYSIRFSEVCGALWRVERQPQVRCDRASTWEGKKVGEIGQEQWRDQPEIDKAAENEDFTAKTGEGAKRLHGSHTELAIRAGDVGQVAGRSCTTAAALLVAALCRKQQPA